MFLLPLISCEAKGKPWSKKDLMEYFADNKVVDLVLAANKGDIKKIDELVQQGVDVNYKGKKNITPLYAQMTSLNNAGFQRLLENGANPNIPIEDGSSVIWYCAFGGEISVELLPMLKLCLQHKGDPNWVYHKKGRDPKGFESGEDGVPLLCIAVMHNEQRIEAMKLLLDAGADINIKDKNGNNALWYAAGGHYEILLYLLQAGADYTAKGNYGKNFIWDLEQSPTVSFGDEKDMAKQKEWKRKVIAFLKEKGIEVHLKYPD